MPRRTKVRYVRPVIVRTEPRYKFTTFVLDMLLAAITGGLWLFWPAFKFLRNGRR